MGLGPADGSWATPRNAIFALLVFGPLKRYETEVASKSFCPYQRDCIVNLEGSRINEKTVTTYQGMP